MPIISPNPFTKPGNVNYLFNLININDVETGEGYPSSGDVAKFRRENYCIPSSPWSWSKALRRCWRRTPSATIRPVRAPTPASFGLNRPELRRAEDLPAVLPRFWEHAWADERETNQFQWISMHNELQRFQLIKPCNRLSSRGRIRWGFCGRWRRRRRNLSPAVSEDLSSSGIQLLLGS